MTQNDMPETFKAVCDNFAEIATVFGYTIVTVMVKTTDVETGGSVHLNSNACCQVHAIEIIKHFIKHSVPTLVPIGEHGETVQ